MKVFLITSFVLLIIALILVVGVFLFLTSSIEPTQPTDDSVSLSPAQSSSSITSSTPAIALRSTTSDSESVEREAPKAIPLRDVPLTDGQKEVVGAVGVDVESFVITATMQSCAEEKLGGERFEEILTGAAPTVLETARLIPCLNGE